MGWPRPAFLIGFVLAGQAETYLYQAVQFNGWGFLARPGVLIIGAITIASVVLGARQRVGESGSETEKKVVALSQRWPQVAFVGLVLALFAYAISDAAKMSFLGSIFPLGVASVMAFLTIYLVWVMILGEVGHPSHYDQEADGRSHAADPGLLHYLLWFGGLFVATALVGFYLAILGFFVVFLWAKAQVSWTRVALLTASAADLSSWCWAIF